MSNPRWLASAVMRSAVKVVVAAALVLSACGSPVQSASSATESTPQAVAAEGTSTDGIVGDASDPVNEIAAAAIDDLQSYWAEQFPAVYGSEYTPVSGGFHAVVPSSGELPPCASSADDIAGNAFYCPGADVVAWDSEGLRPDLRQRFGDFVIPVVMAHEWGHAIQARVNFEGMTVTSEIQADCFAGAWAAHAVSDSTVFDPSEAELDSALAGFLYLRDEPGTSAESASAHGSGFDRVSSFRTGFDGGPMECKPYVDGSPPVLRLPFTSRSYADRGGDAPLAQIIDGVPEDLEDYWSLLFPELTGRPWQPLNPVVAFDPSDAPDCGGRSATGYVLFYCVPDGHVGFDAVDAMLRFYEQGGDFAVAALIATQYGLAGMAQAGIDADDQDASLQGDCFAGSWAASVLLQNRPTSGYTLSPGDLDEAIAALLLFRGEGDQSRQGSGFLRVEAFRHGVMDGAQACIQRSEPT
ncbi:MAG: neutral zinc metallopeptidase [Rhodococcus sp. (in: high G+C Gram-positive bacteria)]